MTLGSKLNHDLAEMTAALHQRERICDFFKRQNPIDHRLDFGRYDGRARCLGRGADHCEPCSRPYVSNALVARRLITPFGIPSQRYKSWYLALRAVSRQEPVLAWFRD